MHLLPAKGESERASRSVVWLVNLFHPCKHPLPSYRTCFLKGSYVCSKFQLINILIFWLCTLCIIAVLQMLYQHVVHY